MRYTSLSLAFAMIFSFFIIQPPAAQALVNKDTMKTQGDLCVWLIYQIGVQGPQAMGPGQAPVGPAVDGKTACEFLKKAAGIQPDGGWEWEKELPREELPGICLGYPDITQAVEPYKSSEETLEAVKNLLAGDDTDRAKFKELVSLIETCIKNRLDPRQLAVFRAKVQTPHLEPI